MKISIKATKISLNKSLRDFVEKKISGLEKFLKDFKSSDPRFQNNNLKAEVEIEKTTFHHKKGPFFRAECQIPLPGRTIRAEEKAEGIKEAVVRVKKEMQREIDRYKNRIKIQIKKGAREAKKRMRANPAAEE